MPCFEATSCSNKGHVVPSPCPRVPCVQLGKTLLLVSLVIFWIWERKVSEEYLRSCMKLPFWWKSTRIPQTIKTEKKNGCCDVPTSTLPPSKLIEFIQSDLPRSSSCIQFTENRSLEDVCWRFVSNQEG